MIESLPLGLTEVLGSCLLGSQPGVPLTTCQPVKFLWILGYPIPYGCVSFIGIHISTKNRAASPLFEELYPTYNLYNSNP